jgi:hypothetical protein
MVLLRYGIKLLLLSLLGIGITPVVGDVTINMPPPPRPSVAPGSVVMGMVAQARAAALSAHAGSDALQRYVQDRRGPSHVYSVQPRRPGARWSDRYDEYERTWRIIHGPRIWGTWYPWGGFWGGGCTVWSIGYPGQQGASFSDGCHAGFRFANLGGGY